jgi:prepilin-type N-terminal cleavage/methylation domain-containing protein
MNRKKPLQAFTLIELLVVIAIIALLAGIALPVFGAAQERAAQTKALSNVKQIILACRIYASDNNDGYPTNALDTNLKPTGSPVGTSNDAFAQLFPQYVSNEQIFWEPKSGYGSVPPDNKIDNPQTSTPAETLKSNECSFAYVLGLFDTSNAAFPLVADAFSSVGSHTYITKENTVGGVWKGQKAIVGFVDASAQIMKVDQNSMTIKASPLGGDLFNTTESNWLTATTNTVVNPK